MKINEIFKNYINDGIFYYFPNSSIWGYENYKNLNLLYHGMRSGQKTAAEILDIAIENGEIKSEMMRQIFAAIYAKYSNKWERVWNALNLDYNAIENYAMQETEKHSEELTNTELSKNGTNTYEKNETDDNTQNSTKTETIAGTETNTMQVAAYNTNSYSNDTQEKLEFANRTNTEENEETNKNIKSGTENHNYTDTENIKETKNERTRTLKRTGNIGVTTSQQMLESELELRKYNFYNTIFADVDSEITIPVWD